MEDLRRILFDHLVGRSGGKGVVVRRKLMVVEGKVNDQAVPRPR